MNTVTTSKIGCERRPRYLEGSSLKLVDAEETQGGTFAAVVSPRPALDGSVLGASDTAQTFLASFRIADQP